MIRGGAVHTDAGGNPWRHVLIKLSFDRRANGNHLMFNVDPHGWSGHSVIMKEAWDEDAAYSAVLACLMVRAAPGESMEAMASSGSKQGRERLPKWLQEQILRSCGGASPFASANMGPRVSNDAVALLKNRYHEFSGDDVRESMGRVRKEFEFLASRNLSESEILALWNEVCVAQVMRS